uniref:uncharacterized protein LOC101242230 isoform X1 n=1 Tax=Ciona intestinalis TaxID=7719 RepID=UPI000EF51CAF|nr:uncharacterized protein LOC101242230 isoform X1 [Ciona intestinalis]|eukprot:XP_018670160.2 uncharacterized protein LOC101242230 isoform X1 [Ciona intestinalis]
MMYRILCVILCSLAVVQKASGIDTIDLITGGQCGVTSQLQGGIVVSHQPIDVLPPISNDITCFFTMRAVKFRQRIRFTFLHFSLTPTDCAVSNLTIYDGLNDSFPIISTICPTDSIAAREFVSTSFWMTLKLVVTRISAPPTANFTGFWNGFTPDRSSPCSQPTEELLCANGRCVFNVLNCDGIDSCGDNTDEGTGPPTFCNQTILTTPPISTTLPPFMTQPPIMTTLITTTTPIPIPGVVGKIFPDLSPLYIILTLAFVMFSVFLVYALLSFECFKACMMTCLHKCCYALIRRRRKWKTAKDKPKNRLRRKITPEKAHTNMTVDNLSTYEMSQNDVSMDMTNGFDQPEPYVTGPTSSNTFIEKPKFPLKKTHFSIAKTKTASRSSITKVNLEFKRK